MKKNILYILISAILLSLCACGSPEAEESSGTSQNSDSAAQELYASTYSGIGLYVDGHYLLDESFSSMITTLNADGSGSLDWGEDNQGEISGWSVTDGELRIRAGVSEIEGRFSDGVMLLDLGDGYVLASVPDGYDISQLNTASLEDYMDYLNGQSEEKSISGTETAAVSEAVAALEENYVGLTEDTLSWSYDESTGTITVSGEGPMRDYCGTRPEWYPYCDAAEHIVIGDGVTSVSPGAFWCFMAVDDVILGDSVEFIGYSAFDSCYELRSINWPSGLKYIGERAFNNALLHSESGFILPEGLLYLGEGAFWSAFKESFVSLPSSLTYIGDQALGNCFLDEFRVSPDNPSYTSENGILYSKDMTTLINYPANKTDTVYEIPESVTEIMQEAIQINSTLEKITIPASVSFIEDGAIYWNYALTAVEVDENNPSYISIDGVLYTKDGKTLLCYPIASPVSEYTIPDGCERIGMAALSFAENLTALSIPDGLKEIGLLGLYRCTGISQINLPDSITKIEGSAFDYCDSLCEIHYAGSDADWENIEIDEENTALFDGSIRIICAE